MNHQAAILTRQGNDRVARNRSTTCCQLNGGAFAATNRQRHAFLNCVPLYLAMSSQALRINRGRCETLADVGIDSALRFFIAVANDVFPSRCRNFIRRNA